MHKDLNSGFNYCSDENPWTQSNNEKLHTCIEYSLYSKARAIMYRDFECNYIMNCHSIWQSQPPPRVPRPIFLPVSLSFFVLLLLLRTCPPLCTFAIWSGRGQHTISNLYHVCVCLFEWMHSHVHHIIRKGIYVLILAFAHIHTIDGDQLNIRSVFYYCYYYCLNKITKIFNNNKIFGMPADTIIAK